MIATDVIRQVLRAFFTAEAMPSVHHSAFDAGGLEGYADQAGHVATAAEAMVERAAERGQADGARGRARASRRRWPTTSASAACWSRRCWWWRTRSSTAATSPTARARRPAERYLAAFDEIRAAAEPPQRERARCRGVAVIDNANVDAALGRLMQLVLDAVEEAT